MKLNIIDKGETKMTGGRIKRIIPYVKEDDAFCLTYGDGVADVNITKLIEFHKSHGKIGTLTATYLEGRFGALEFSGNQIKEFKEKPRGDGSFINGGFFVLSPKIESYITNDTDCIFEQEPLKNLALNNELMAFKHEGFWQPMDTLRDKLSLEKQWEAGEAKWKIWK
jgi:glucose-1-phosphate cytidylyltransferase